MDMVKRVADAINAELLKPWDETIGGPKQSERLALAAMRAMDEPTEEMLPDVKPRQVRDLSSWSSAQPASLN
jgi:hypothetical protein